MRNTNKSGFTLVELIVVITILAILGTIAFISLGSYTSDARNSKRSDAITKVATVIENDRLSGKSLLSYVANSDSALTSITLGGNDNTTTAASNKYDAGDINHTALGVKPEQFKDEGSDYVIGATTYIGGAYEIAAKLEEGASFKTAVVGTYVPRAVNATANIASATPGTDSSVTYSSPANINSYKIGDVTNFGTVSNISSDGLTISFNPLAAAAAATDVLALAVAESDGLIGAEGNLGTAITNNDTTNYPY